MKTLLLIPAVALMASCTSFYGARQLADYNHDGYVSDAEASEFHKQRSVEDHAIYNESNRRRNVTNTVRDANQAVWGTHSLIRGIEAF